MLDHVSVKPFDQRHSKQSVPLASVGLRTLLKDLQTYERRRQMESKVLFSLAGQCENVCKQIPLLTRCHANYSDMTSAGTRCLFRLWLVLPAGQKIANNIVKVFNKSSTILV